MGERSPAGSRQPWDLARPLRWLVGLAFIAIVALTIAQVFFRFALDRPLIWSEELARLLLVWMTFTGAAVLAWDGRHLSVDVGFRLLPPRARAVVRWLNLAIALAFLVALAWSSVRLVRIEAMADLGALGIPASWVRLPATVGGVSIVAFLLLRRFWRLRGVAPADIDDTV